MILLIVILFIKRKKKNKTKKKTKKKYIYLYIYSVEGMHEEGRWGRKEEDACCSLKKPTHFQPSFLPSALRFQIEDLFYIIMDIVHIYIYIVVLFYFYFF